LPTNYNFPRSKFISAPVLSRKSVPSRQSASVVIRHTRNLWSNFRPSKTKETCCWPLMFTAFPVTPYAFMDVALTSLCDTPGWSIETLDPVSTMRRFGSPSISNETVGKPCSSRTETVGLSTAFPWLSRWRELPSLSPLNRFSGSCFPVCLPGSWGEGFHRRKSGDASNARSDFPFQASFGFLPPLIS